MMRDYAPLDNFLNGLIGDIYSEVPSEPHLSITRGTIDGLYRDGLIAAGARVLDVGCGQGLALDWFRILGLDAVGITLGPDGGSLPVQRLRCPRDGPEFHGLLNLPPG
jgi:hypothetical protein